MPLLGIGATADMDVVSIQTLDNKYQETARQVLNQLFNTAVLNRKELTDAEEGAGNKAEIAILRWLLRHWQIEKRQIHRAMQYLNEKVDAHEMVQLTNFLVPPQ